MPTLPWEVAAKAVLYASALTAIGTCALGSWLLPSLARQRMVEVEAIAAGLSSLRIVAAVVVLLALGLRALTHSADVFGWPDALSWDSLQVVAIQSRWGSAWRLQVAAASVFMAASVWAGQSAQGRQRIPRRSTIAALACIVLCYSLPLLGHGASSRWQVLLHGTHILGAGLWTGLLTALVLIRVPPGQRLTLFRGVSPLALVGASMVILPGIVMAWSYVGSVSNLWRTTYGQVLTLKLALFGGVVGCGLANWRRFDGERRGAPQSETAAAVRIEVALATVIVVLTGVLTELAHP